MVRFLCAAICAVLFSVISFQPLNAQEMDGTPPEWRRMASEEGGLIFLMRHTDKASGDEIRKNYHPDGFDESICVIRQGLTQTGVDRAAAVGADLSRGALPVRFSYAFSSGLCRTAHTAFLASGGVMPDTAHQIAEGRPYGVISDAEAQSAEAFRAMISAAARAAQKERKNVLVSIHSNWIEALLDDDDSIRTKVGTLDADPWPMDQCFGEVRIYRVTDNYAWEPVGIDATHTTPPNGGACTAK